MTRREALLGFVVPLSVAFGHSSGKCAAQNQWQIEQYNAEIKAANAAIDDFVMTVNSPLVGVPRAWNALMEIVGGFNAKTLDLKRRRMRDDAIIIVRNAWQASTEKLDKALLRIGAI